MLELPEAVAISSQITETLRGKKIASVVAAASPHKFAWYTGDPAEYNGRLAGKTMGGARAVGGMVEVQAGDVVLVFSDGICLRYLEPGDPRPAKHQLLIEFDDSCALAASVQMYGGLSCFIPAQHDDPYYRSAREMPSPLTDQFDRAHFDRILASVEQEPNLSAKALLATKQRVPGLGNGVLQDILYNARINPRRKVSGMSVSEKESLLASVKSTLSQMTSEGGRDTERDLFGRPGGYQTLVSKNTAGQPCRRCGAIIRKEAYMGGSVYYCPGCQAL